MFYSDLQGSLAPICIPTKFSPSNIFSCIRLPQLPEPIMPFRHYNSLMGLAKESLQGEAETPEEEEAESNPAVGKGSELVDLGPDTDPEVLILVDKLKELLKDLPKANIATLRYIIRHLRRSVFKKTKAAGK